MSRRQTGLPKIMSTRSRELAVDQGKRWSGLIAACYYGRDCAARSWGRVKSRNRGGLGSCRARRMACWPGVVRTVVASRSRPTGQPGYCGGSGVVPRSSPRLAWQRGGRRRSRRRQPARANRSCTGRPSIQTTTPQVSAFNSCTVWCLSCAKRTEACALCSSCPQPSSRRVGGRAPDQTEAAAGSGGVGGRVALAAVARERRPGCIGAGGAASGRRYLTVRPGRLRPGPGSGPAGGVGLGHRPRARQAPETVTERRVAWFGARVLALGGGLTVSRTAVRLRRTLWCASVHCEHNGGRGRSVAP